MSDPPPDGNEERRGASRARQVPPPAWTIGHSTLPIDGFVERLAAYRIERVADVRRFPASRRHPQFNHESLAASLAARGIEVRWFEALGGRRSAARGSVSPNTGIRVAAFRAYADNMASAEFRDAFAELVEWLRGGRAALLCAELLWWRCHRRLLSDLLVARAGAVTHIMGDDATQPHVLWDLAVARNDGLVYPAPQTELGIEPPA